MQKKEDKKTCFSRSSFAKNPEKNCSGRKDAERLMSRETKANVNNQLTVGRARVQKNVKYLSLKESREHKRQREEKRAQRNTCQREKNHLSLG